MNADHVAWAKELRRETRQLTRMAYSPGFWTEVDRLRHLTLSAFSTFKDHPHDRPVLRVFVDNGLRYDLSQRLGSRVPPSSRSFEEWAKSQIGSDRFCLTLNGLTKWCEPLHQWLQRDFVNPLLAEVGRPTTGGEFYAFVGNYGLTPFGIHDDADHTLLIHLGPNQKIVYVWPREEYRRLTGGVFGCFEFPRLRKAAIRYVLSNGDLLFIPPGDFHVLNSRDFSVTLGFTIFPPSPATELAEAAPLCEDLRGVSIAQALRRSRLLIRSNGWITTRPQLESAHSRRGLGFVVPEAFPLLYAVHNGWLEIFGRGRSIRLRNVAGMTDLLSFLNKHQIFTYKEVYVLLNRFHWTVARRILERLHQFRAIVQAPGRDESRTEVWLGMDSK